MSCTDSRPPRPPHPLSESLERTDLRLAQARAEGVEETFRRLVSSIKDYGIFLLDPQGCIRSWNVGAERIEGYTEAEILGQHFSVFYTEEDRARDHPAHELEIAAAEGRYEEEGWRVRKDGSRFWANVIITRFDDAAGHLTGFSKVTRDLSERKATEDALRRSEEEARLIFESVKDYAIISLDVNGRVRAWNEGARRMKGYEAQEIIGQHFSVFYPPEDVESGKCDYELREAALTGRFEDEGWRVRRDGTRFWANVIITALFGKNQKLVGFSKVTRDMTERKRAEDRLRMANENLEKRVEERTQSLTEVNEKLRMEVQERKRVESQLRHAIRARDEFLSIASHELRTPVTPLKLQLQGILSHLHKGTLNTVSPERLEKTAKTLDRSLNRLSRLIDSLLDVARINVGKIELHPEEFNAGDVIHETVTRFQSEARLAGSDLTVTGPEALEVNLDRTRLEQVLSNLIVNAIKYGDRKPVQVRFEGREGRLRVTVADQGLGVARDDFERIFERFVQVGGMSTSGGLGLGLYISRQIVQAQGGKIWLESQLGKGSTFIFEVPLKAPHVEELKRP